MNGTGIALLGRGDSPTDGVEDYCRFLGNALARAGYRLELERVPWAERGWIQALGWLWRKSAEWREKWVLVQYTALGWSRQGIPAGFLVVLYLLRRRRARSVVVFHDSVAYPGDRPIDRMRRACQRCIMRRAFHWAEKSVFTMPVEHVPWAPRNTAKVEFIPVGANIPPVPGEQTVAVPAPRAEKCVAVFSITPGKPMQQEVSDIAYVATRAAERVAKLRLVILGRNSEEAREPLRHALNGTRVDVSALGLLPAEEVTRVLSTADVLLFVRAEVSSRRGSAIVGLACGLPVVGYSGQETGFPVTEAGVVLVPRGDREALGQALCRVLTDEPFRQQLCQRSLRAYRDYFSWDVIARHYLQLLARQGNERQ